MSIPIEFSELIDVTPNTFVAGMEYVWPILVNVDPSISIIFSVTVAADVIAFLDD
jgi:hypothetical protein